MSISLTRRYIDVRTAVYVFLLTLVYTVCAALFIREILLPYILTGLHAGDGFLVGGDSAGFHEKAKYLAEEIRRHGWQVWELKPYATEDTPAGIASAIYAVLGPSPRWLVPFNAVIHALSATVLFLILRAVMLRTAPALIGAALFVVMPTTAYWYSQLHKDGIYILGVYLFFAGWVLLFERRPATIGRLLACAILFCFGIAIIWMVREYAVTVMFGASALMAPPFLVLLAWRWFKKSSDWMDVSKRVAILSTLLALTGMLSGQGISRELYSTDPVIPPSIQVDNNGSSEVILGSTPEFQEIAKEKRSFCRGWEYTGIIPRSIDNLAASIIRTRSGYYSPVYSSAGSTIDREYCIQSILDFVLYMPRAFQVAFFAPFPQQWVEDGAVGGRAGRLIAGAEMLLFYVLFICTLIVAWRLRRNELLWLTLLFSTAMLILYAIVTPNIGALHRMRYGFLVLFLSPGAGVIGCWLLHAILQRLRLQRQ